MAIGFVIVGLGVLAAIALSFWDKIFNTFKDTIVPILQADMPELASVVTDAFMKIDSTIARPVRRAAKEAWLKVRDFLIDAKEEYTETDDGHYTAKATSYSRTTTPGEFREVTSSRTVTLDEMPDDIREKFMRAQQKPVVDILKTRDKQLELSS